MKGGRRTKGERGKGREEGQTRQRELRGGHHYVRGRRDFGGTEAERGN